MGASAMEISRYEKWTAVPMEVHEQHSFKLRVVDGIRLKSLQASGNCGS